MKDSSLTPKEWTEYLGGTVLWDSGNGTASPFIFSGLVTKRDKSGRFVFSAQLSDSNSIYNVPLSSIQPGQTYHDALEWKRAKERKKKR